jgi:cell division septal protein FtsQ
MSLPVEKRREWIKSRREQRKLTKYARLRRQFLRYFVLLAMLSLGVFAFYRMHCHLNENKNGLIIEGNFVASNKQISDVLKPEVTNTPLFLLNPNELENKIKELSAIKYAFVRRYVLPNPILKVAVLEEFPWATIYCSEAVCANAKCQPVVRLGAGITAGFPGTIDLAGVKAKWVVSESGRLIAIAEFPNVYQPALKIYTKNTGQFNLNQADIEQWANWLAYISKQMQCSIIALDMRESHNVKVETSKFIIVLGNPDSGLTRRLNRLPSVLEVLANQHRDPVYINLALNSNIPVKLAKKSDKSNSDTKALN